jgi:hypothetical protein
VPGHKGINGNEIADQLAGEGTSHPITGPQPAPGLSTKFVRMITDWTHRIHKEHWQSTCGQWQDKGLFKKPCARKSGELLSISRIQLRITTGLLTGHCHLKGHLFKNGLVYSPKCDRCKQASEMASHVLCDHVELATLRFRHVSHIL